MQCTTQQNREKYLVIMEDKLTPSLTDESCFWPAAYTKPIALLYSSGRCRKNGEICFLFFHSNFYSSFLLFSCCYPPNICCGTQTNFWPTAYIKPLLLLWTSRLCRKTVGIGLFLTLLQWFLRTIFTIFMQLSTQHTLWDILSHRPIFVPASYTSTSPFSIQLGVAK